MAVRGRPIRIQIPEELRLTRNEIDSLARVFLEQLQIVEAPGDVTAVPSQPINTTKMAVEVELVGPRPIRGVRRGPARKPAKKADKKADKKAGKKPAGKAGK